MLRSGTSTGTIAAKKTTATVYGPPAPPYGPPNPYAIEKRAREQFLSHVKSREGYRLDVYIDTTGNLTVGWGHKVVASDGLKLGDKITPARALAFLAADSEKAFSAALSQAREAAQFNENMIVALASVNFQLGTGWRSKFSNTWKLIKKGDFQAAIRNLKVSAWFKQTPVRVADFINALNRAGVA